MKVILALFVGIAVGFFFARAGSTPENSPTTTLATAPGDMPPMPTPMANPGPRPTWKARIAPPTPAPESTEKKRMLENLTEADIEEWRRGKEERIDEFLKNNPEYWHEGFNGQDENSKRIDRKVLKDALGLYEGDMKYSLGEIEGPASYRLNLALNSADGSRQSKISMQGGRAGENGSMAAAFNYSVLGSDGRDLHVVWNNYNGHEQRYASSYAFKFRSGMNVGEKEIVPLVGLTAELKWREIGTVELRRVK